MINFEDKYLPFGIFALAVLRFDKCYNTCQAAYLSVRLTFAPSPCQQIGQMSVNSCSLIKSNFINSTHEITRKTL